MRFDVLVSVLLSVSLMGRVICADAPKLPDTTERLTSAEEKEAQQAVSKEGRTTASRDYDHPFPRILIVPKELQTLYDKKPKATVRLLLKMVEAGQAQDSINAVCCIEALVWGPEFGAITAQGTDDKAWDDIIGGANLNTAREFHRQICIKVIIKKEKGKDDKNKE